MKVAGFIRAFFYFWVFGCISVLLDLDHIIQVYKDGLEINLENLAYHGTRTLHIPILILVGGIFLVIAALFLRFLNLNPDFLKTRKVVIIECPECNHRTTLQPSIGNLEFPCPFCGVWGILEFN